MAKKKKQQQAPSQPVRPNWVFDRGIPTEDFFEGRSLDDSWNLQEAIENFVYYVEEDRFLTWEAVAAREQGLPLTARQEAALEELLDFSDGDEEQILYIDEFARPSEPWDVILNRIVPHLLIEPFKTSEEYEETKCEGWDELIFALREHGTGLSLPAGAGSPEEVVPAELRHKLWLQGCFDEALAGLGQPGEESTLSAPEEQERIGEFVECLRECKESVAYFGLTLESLLERVILPEGDRPLFVKLMQNKLDLKSAADPLAPHL